MLASFLLILELYRVGYNLDSSPRALNLVSKRTQP
jgi:hypothetical protein